MHKIFCEKENIDIIKDFIESILNIKIKEIYFNKYSEDGKSMLPKENFGIVNVKIEIESGDKLNIGIQIVDGIYIQSKLLFYYYKIYANNVLNMDEKNITINILHTNFLNNNEYYQKIKLKDKEEKNEYEIYVIELLKFKNKIMVENKRDEWIAYLQGDNEVLVNYVMSKNKKIQKLDKLLDEYWKNEKID